MLVVGWVRVRGRSRESSWRGASGARLGRMGGRIREKIFHSFFKRGIGICDNYFYKLLGRYRRAGQAGWGEEECG